MNKPVILSLAAMACAMLVFAVPSYTSLGHDPVIQGKAENVDKVTGKNWQCVTQTGPDAPNLIVLRENGSFMKLIDYSEVTDNGTNYDLQGRFDIKQDRLLAHIGKPSGEVYTDAYTVEPLDGGKMQMTRSVDNAENSKTGNTRYSCRMQASRS